MRDFSIALFVGFVIGSLGEYWVHRAMHSGRLYGAEHLAHHSLNGSQGWLREYWAYLRATTHWLVLVAIPLYWYLGEACALGWLIGTFGFLAFSAYTHMAYHIDPNMVFWIRRPIHVFHHREARSRHNFGVTNTVWDHVFGTYKDDPSWHEHPVPWRKFLTVPWL